MKKFICKVIVVSLLSAGLVSGAYAMDMDVTGYKKIARETIKEALSGSISDIDGLIAKQEKLMKMGIEGCREHAKEHPKDAKIMDLVIKNAEKMKAMTLDEIEEAWHEGGVLNENGIDVDSMDHMSTVLSHLDLVVHPATTYIALKEYKKTRDADLLDQVKDELAEVLKHLKHLD